VGTANGTLESRGQIRRGFHLNRFLVAPIRSVRRRSCGRGTVGTLRTSLGKSLRHHGECRIEGRVNDRSSGVGPRRRALTCFYRPPVLMYSSVNGVS
jgi:hypothetical protein